MMKPIHTCTCSTYKGCFLQPPSNKRKKLDLPKEGEIVAILTESLGDTPWLGQVEKAQGGDLSILWMEGSYSSAWKVATIRKGKKTLKWRDTVSVKTVILSGITLTENDELTKELVSFIKDTYSSYF